MQSQKSLSAHFTSKQIPPFGFERRNRSHPMIQSLAFPSRLVDALFNFGSLCCSWSYTLHRALCCLFRPDTDGMRVSKCGQLSQQTRRLDPMLFQCWSSAVGGVPILKQHWVKCSRLLGSTQVSVYTHPSATMIFSPADQGTFSKTAGQSQAYYNTWNWERGTYDVNQLHILTCEGAVSRVSSVIYSGATML